LGLDKPRVRERDEGPKPTVIDAAEDADRTIGLVIPENADLELVRSPCFALSLEGFVFADSRGEGGMSQRLQVV